MTVSTTREQLRRQTAAAMAKYSTARSVAEALGSRAPAVGDLLIITELGSVPELWAVIDHESGPPERLLVVPADLHPLRTSRDLRVGSDSPSGSLTLRCEFGVWLDARLLAGRQRTSVLDPASLDRAQRKWARIEAGTLPDLALDRDTEAEQEYRDLHTELHAARQQLMALEVPAGPEQPVPSRRGGRFRDWAMAASILVAVGLGAIMGWLGRGPELERQRQAQELELERQIQGLERAQAKRSAAEQAQQVEQQRISVLEREAARAQSTIEALRQRLKSAALRPLADLPFEWLQPAESFRSAERLRQEIRVPRDTRYFAVFLAVESLSGLRETGRVEIFTDPDGQRLWQQSVGDEGVSEIFLLLPSAMFPPGNYTLHLYLSAEAEASSVYALKVTEGPHQVEAR